MIIAIFLSCFAMAIICEIVLHKWGMTAHLVSIGCFVVLLLLILKSYFGV